MTDTQLNLFNSGRFLELLNSRLKEGNPPIELGEVSVKKPGKNPALNVADWLLDRERKFAVRFPLIRVYGGLFGIDVESEVGYVLIRRGNNEVDSDPSSYERLRFRTNDAFVFKEGVVLPECRIEIYSEGCRGKETFFRREDYVRRGFGWKKRDISGIVPTDWFSPGEISATA